MYGTITHPHLLTEATGTVVTGKDNYPDLAGAQDGLYLCLFVRRLQLISFGSASYLPSSTNWGLLIGAFM